MTNADFRSWNLSENDAAAVLHGPEPARTSGTTLADLVLEQARSSPELVAVDDGRNSLSYLELARRAGAVATWLLERGADAGSRIAVLADRVTNVYPAVVGILLARCAYVPIDPGSPWPRTHQILDRASCAFAVTSAETLADSDLSAMPTLLLDDPLPFQLGAVREGRLTPMSELADVDWRAPRGERADLAYVIFTSGSSGRPKGVMIEHRSAVNLAHWVRDVTVMRPGSRVTQNASLFFDASVQQIFSAWSAGAALMPVPQDVRLDGKRMLEWLAARRITHWDSVPSLWSPVVAAAHDAPDDWARLPYLRAIMLAGEPLSSLDVVRWRPWDKGHRLFNIYGPTEATVDATFYEVTEPPTGTSVPIGRPLPGVDCYILDGHGRPAPPGNSGELYLGGVCLARGYLGEHDEGTAFALRNIEGEGRVRLYRTGDFVRVIDGSLHFIGRQDNQVKVNGVRIDVSEIEYALRRDQRVIDAAAIAVPKAAQAGCDLGALIVAPADTRTDEVRSQLLLELPAAMIPSKLLIVDALPRTANGKVDRQACADLLANPQPVFTGEGKTVSPAESQMCRIWQSILGNEDIGVDDDFFAVGGDSIAAIRLGHACAEEGISVQSADVFAHPTPRRLARHAGIAQTGTPRSSAGRLADPPPSPDESQWVPLLPAQRAIVVASVLADSAPRGSRTGLIQERHAYSGAFDLAALRVALDLLTERYDVLRLAIEIDGDAEPRQAFLRSAVIPLSVHDVSQLSSAEQMRRVDEVRRGRIDEGFDLSRPPLLRCDAIRRAPDCFDLIWTMHHAIIDGWSWDIVASAFYQVYTSARDGFFRPLPKLRLSYRDVIRQAAIQDGVRVPAEFVQELATMSPLRLPRRPADPASPSAWIPHPSLERLVSADTHAAVSRLAARVKVTTGTVYLYCLARALARLARQTSFPLGIVTSGRNVTIGGIDSVVGCLARQVPVAIHADPSIDTVTVLRQLCDQITGAVGLDGADIEGTLTEAGIHPLVRSPEISFSYQNYPPASAPDEAAPHHTLIDPTQSDWIETAAVPLSVVMYTKGNGDMECRLEYWSDAIEPGFAESIAVELERALRRVVTEHCL